jgi:Ca2+-transporting ATPase
MWINIGFMGILFFIIMLVLLITQWTNLTQFFTIFVMLQWWNLFNARVFNQNRSIFNGLGDNLAFIAIISVILVGQILIVQFGGEMFRTEPLSLKEWLCIFGATSLVALIREIMYWSQKFLKSVN